MENKLTAIEWLEYQFLSPATLYGHDFIMDKLKHAKEMEKEQIRDAWTDGCIGELYELNAYFSSGKYYNATYGKE
jgi:hypothetical protein